MVPSTVKPSTWKEEKVGHIFLRKGALSVTHPMLFSNLVVWVIGNIAQKINDTITLSLANSSKLSERTRNLSWRKSKVITRTVCTTPLIILEMPATKQSYAVINWLQANCIHIISYWQLIRVSLSNTCSQLCKS